MNKQGRFTFLVIIFLCYIFPMHTFGAEIAEELMPKLDYDAASQRLSGETVPNANITFSAFVGDILADDEGKFDLPVPPEIKQSHIRIDDYLNDRYLELDFDFTTGTLATTGTEINDSTSTSLSKENQASAKTTNKESRAPIETSTPKKTDHSLILWVILLVLIVSVTVVGLLYRQKKKDEKSKVNKKRTRRKKRKHRKKRTTSRK